MFCLLMAASPVRADRTVSPDPLGYVSPSRDFDALHIKVDLDLDVVGGRIEGSVTHRLRALKPGARNIHLNCVGLDVAEVKIDGSSVDFDYPVPGRSATSWIDVADMRDATTELVVHATDGFDLDDEFELTVKYSGAPTQGLYFIPPEKGIPEKRYEVWAQGEGEDNRYWIPSFDYPNDKATYEGIYRVDKGMKVISNGLLVEEKAVGNKTQFHWRLAKPQVNYLITVAASTYDIVEEEWNGMPVMYVVPPGTDDDTIQRAYGLTTDMLDFYSRYIGIDYPFEKYAQVTVQNFIYGGMENTGTTVMNSRILYDERHDLTDNEQGLVAHELAHQWWGDMVTCAEWSHMWLNEGFSTYFQVLYRGYHEGEDALRYNMDVHHRKTVEIDNKDARPLVVDFYNRRDRRNSANVYRRGAAVLHMLRFILGDDLFRRSINAYGNRFKYGLAETSDFSKVIRETTGENLDWFFEQWAYLTGHPKLRVTKSWENGTLTLNIEQTQKIENLTPVFRLPMDIEITTGKETTTHRILVDQNNQSFSFEVPSRPLMVIVDKGSWTLKTMDFKRTQSELLYQFTHGDVIERIEAARAMGSSKANEETIAALRDVLGHDGVFWGLRHESAIALGEIGNASARDALLEATKLSDAQARKAVAMALGSMKTDDATEKALRRLVENDRAYQVSEEALKSLVKMKASNAEKVCVEALDMPSHQGVIRKAAVGGLADLRATERLDDVASLAAPGNRRTYRHDAIKAYAKLARDLESDRARRKAADFLTDMLDDWYLRTRREVITALGTLGEPAAVDDLRRLAANDPVESLRSRARRTADKIEARNAATAKGEDLQAEIDELTRQIQSLKGEIESLQAEVDERNERRLTRKNDGD
jgi:aminopeptidase N